MPPQPPPATFDVLTGTLIGRLDDHRESGLLLSILTDSGRTASAVLPRSAADRVRPDHVGMRVHVHVLLGVAIEVVIQVWP